MGQSACSAKASAKAIERVHEPPAVLFRCEIVGLREYASRHEAMYQVFFIAVRTVSAKQARWPLRTTEQHHTSPSSSLDGCACRPSPQPPFYPQPHICTVTLSHTLPFCGLHRSYCSPLLRPPASPISGAARPPPFPTRHSVSAYPKLPREAAVRSQLTGAELTYRTAVLRAALPLAV